MIRKHSHNPRRQKRTAPRSKRPASRPNLPSKKPESAIVPLKSSGSGIMKQLRFLTHALESITEIVSITDLRDRFVFVNRAFLENYGYLSKEILGQHVSILGSRSLTPEARKVILAESRKRGWKGEIYNRTKAGRELLIALSTSPIRNEQRKIIGLIGIAQDITEKRGAEEELRTTRDQLNNIFGNLEREAFWSFDPRSKKVLYNSESMERIYNRPLTEFYTDVNLWKRVIHPDDIASVETNEQQVLAGQAMRTEYRILRPDGEVRWLDETSIPVFGPGDELVRIDGVLIDVTDRKQSEEQLRRMNLELEERADDRTAELVARKDELAKVNEALSRMVTQLADAKIQAEAASKAKSQFLTNVSHELRTPLNSVIGFANVLTKNKGGRLDPVEVAYAERILDNGKHLLDVISQILDLSKVEAGKVELDLVSVAVELLIRETVEEMEIQARERGVKIELEIPALLRPIETDRKKLKQILINLLGNALKFTERGGIKVRVERDSIGSTPLRIDVIDTGIGIPGHLLDEIFEAFNQADNTTKRKYEGTGLGLTISRSLCDLLGYELFVRSEEGRGSVFSLFLGRRMEQRNV